MGADSALGQLWLFSLVAMTPFLLSILCDPVTRGPLTLCDAEYDASGNIWSGRLINAEGRVYPVRAGIPRFVGDESGELAESVRSFGDEWNHFNFKRHKIQWLDHTVANTFGSVDSFRDKVVVDAGAGSGSQSAWMLEAGARHVILLELSHAVDGVISRNLKEGGCSNYDIIQCSIDAPPIADASIDGIVICHNVIQHTPDVKKTAEALFRIVAPGGEFVFNCYPKNDAGFLRSLRFRLVHVGFRSIMRRAPFSVTLAYARLMGALRLVPLLGYGIEKAGLCVQGEVRDRVKGTAKLKARYRATALNTFDAFGSHTYQHYLSDDQIRTMVRELQPASEKVLNLDRYFLRPPPIGCAIRVGK